MSVRATARLRRLGVIVTDSGAPRLRRVATEMPSVEVDVPADPGDREVIVATSGWLQGAGFASVDRRFAESGGARVSVCGPADAIERVAIEVLTRCQRFVDRRNLASSSPLWDAVRSAHAELHDVSKPLVAADLDHAVDTWQWMLRLAPDAGLPAQLAALLHDVERLESEADRRVEQHAPDYVAFKVGHARRGAERAYEVLRRAGVDERIAARTRDIVAAHERRGEDGDVDLLNDADALSFFSLNSPGYADYFGAEQTRRKVAYTLTRLGDRARGELAWVRLRDDVRAHLIAEGGA
jgi:hypothetical protein